MCLKCVRIEPSSVFGIHKAYVPCGHCADCRQKEQNAWHFRINAEFLSLIKKGWNVGFCTLTYRDDDLPIIPKVCFKNPEDYERIPCFSRSDVRQWIDRVRQFCKSHYRFVKDKNTHEDRRIRYFVASELGSLRHRPHYHVILAWPSSVSYEEMHKLISDKWTHGFLFPRHPEGDDRMLSFKVVGDATKCFGYISKYISKDLELDRLIGDKSRFYSDGRHYEDDSDEKVLFDIWKNCQSFHLQSQSFGFESIRNLSDSEKMDILRHGMCFTSDGVFYQVPMYIKNKLVYDPYYVYDEDGKRLVRRKASEFFLANAREIFQQKANYYTSLCLGSESVEYFVQRGLKPDIAKSISDALQYYHRNFIKYLPELENTELIGEYYLAFHRVSLDYCFNIPPLAQWMLRYYPDAYANPTNDRIFIFNLSHLEPYFDLVDSSNALLGSMDIDKRQEREEVLLRCLDFFNNIIDNKELF